MLNSLNDFLDAITASYLEKRNFGGEYIFKFTDTMLDVEFIDCLEEKENVLQYEFEDKRLKDIIKINFDFKEDISSYELLGMNNFSFHCSLPIIKTLIVYDWLKLQDIQPFKKFTKKTSSYKVREIVEPETNIKKCLKEVNNLVMAAYDERNKEFQVGYKKGKSILDNAKQHVYNNYAVHLDLKDFYPSCKRKYVKKYVQFMFNSSSDAFLEKFLDIIIDEKTDGLFLGNPCSGSISNAILSVPVKHMFNYFKKNELVCTVYADDITVSASRKINPTYVKDIVETILKEHGMDADFKIKEEKTKAFSNNRRKVTGLIINHEDQISVKRKFYEDLRVALYRLSKNQPIKWNKQTLMGKINFAKHVDTSGKINKLLAKYSHII